jgi:hypothetical protein
MEEGRSAQASRIESTLTSHRWIFAKTVPHNPHWYTLRREWADDALFDEVVTYIRVHGINERYGGRDYTVLFLGGFKYWTMGSPLDQTILINRKPVDEVAPNSSASGTLFQEVSK